MFETNNKIRQEDLEELANEKIFEEFAGKTVLVTGASGLIGSEIVLGFLCADRLKKLNIKVLAMVRNEQKARDVFECVLENKNFELIIQDVNDPVSYRGNVDYIIAGRISIIGIKEKSFLYIFECLYLMYFF